jgi:hypothetical protein
MIEFLVAIVPLLLLLGLLICGRYPGHRAAMRLAERVFAPATVRSAICNWQRPSPPTAQTIRGGLLIAFGHAQRPPPLAP